MPQELEKVPILKRLETSDDDVMLRSIATSSPATPSCKKCGSSMSVIAIARDNGHYRLTACSPCDDRVWTRDGQPVASDDAITALGEAS